MFKRVLKRCALSRARYRDYRKIHRVYALTYLAFFLLTVFVCTLLSLFQIGGVEEFFSAFEFRHTGDAESVNALSLFLSVLPLYLLSFTFGVTIYAPLFGGIMSIFCAVFCGARLHMLILSQLSAPDLSGILYFVAALIIFTPLLLVIFAFSAAVSIKVFTPRKAGVKEEDRAFGGSLFCAPYFEGCINLRFLGTYLLIFLAFAVLLFLACAALAAIYTGI